MKPEGRIEPEIIIRRVRARHAGGHHGGAWKIAYADFVTAMMAFFMLLWIIGATNDDQRKGIADYFTPTVIQMKNSGGASGVMDGRSIRMEDGAAPRATAADDTRFRVVERIIAARLAGDPTLKSLRGQLRLVRTADGLRIDLIERADFAMFGSGTSDLGP